MRKLMVLAILSGLLLGAAPLCASELYLPSAPRLPDLNPLDPIPAELPRIEPGELPPARDYSGRYTDPYDPAPDTPEGQDMRDSNPYYNRDGTLR